MQTVGQVILVGRRVLQDLHRGAAGGDGGWARHSNTYKGVGGGNFHGVYLIYGIHVVIQSM